MNRLVSYLTLGLAVIGFLFVGGLRTEVQLTPQAKENVTRLGQGVQEVKRYVQSWFIDEEDAQVVTETIEVSRPTSFNVNYDAALEIVYEMLEDLEHLFTSEQKQAIEKEMNQLYKQQLLKEYKNQLAPSYYE